ncbi:MAG TPA: LysR family transcriptional regulator [Ramlibacter sp.]|nr:LysR family transcriptional regulator [Ramlibacter sp.]
MQDVPSLTTITGRLRFRQLQFLIALDEHGSLHKVAEQLAMTQPGATKMLRELEATFGATLFERSRRGVEPNELGRCVVRYARLAQADLGQLRQEIAGMLTGKGGHLAVGGIGGAVAAVLVEAVVRLRRLQPSISISLREDTSAGLLAALDAGRIELALCRTSVAARPELYDWELQAEEPVAVAVGPGHVLARARKVKLADLSASSWVVYPATMPLRTLLEREFNAAGLPMPAYTVETASLFATVLLLQKDPTLAALLPAGTAAAYAGHGMAVQLPLVLRTRSQPFGIVTRKGWQPSPAAALMVRVLRELRDAAG